MEYKMTIAGLEQVREGKTKWKQIQKTGKTIYKKAAR